MEERSEVMLTADSKYSARFVQSFPVDLETEKIDLNQWITEMTDRDYVSYSKAHKMMTSFIRDGALHMKNLENIGTESLIQRYELKYSSPRHVQLYSSDTTAYLVRWLPARVSVAWEMFLTKTSNQTCDLTCLVGIDFPNLFLRIAAWLSGLGGFFLRRHLNEEGRNFAKDLERKFNRK